jgi:tetratricopeptide (TPR) repeat protein
MGIFDKVGTRRDDPVVATARQHVARAEQHHEAGRVRDAVNEYQQALSLHAECWDAHWGLGRCYHDLAGDANRRAGGGIYFSAGLDELDRAIAELEIVVREQPEAADAFLVLGHACDNRGRLEDAERFYRRAIALDPEGMDGADAHFNLALLLYMRAIGWAGLPGVPKGVIDLDSPLLPSAFTEAERGIAVGERVAAKYPEYKPSLVRQHRRYAGWCMQRGWGKTAIEHYQAVLRLDPDNAEARAWLLKAEGEVGHKLL